tara:strand:- start:47 stop:901 length:855 start_codon:yes stop_codon:yes gene_type:complete
MPGICVANTPAICGHPQTGSTTVFIAGNGVCRVQTDTAGGLIIGPGSQSVFVEGLKVSLPGDLITTHAPCPIPPIHCATTTNPIGNPSVFAGTGFTSDTVVGVGSGDPEDAPSPDLVVTSFEASLSVLHASGQGYYPPTNMYSAYIKCVGQKKDEYGDNIPFKTPATLPTVTYSYTIKNDSIYTSQPFVVGFWRFLNATNAPDNAILTMDSLEFYPDVELVAQESVGSMAPGETYSSTFQYNDLYYSNVGTYAFGIFADIYNTSTEADERNSAPTIIVNVDNKC